MKIRYALLLLLAFTLNGCKSKFSIFNRDILNYAKNDNRIDQQEYEKLVTQIKASNQKGFQNLKSKEGKIDDAKVVEYLLKYFKAYRLSLSSEDIWQPETIKSQVERFNINVFIENSKSIDGYVKDNSTFKTTIFKLLTDLKNLSVADSLNLNYINTKPIPLKVSANRDDIDDFYKRLNPLDFKKGGGNRSSTDIEKMVKQLLDQTNKKNLSVFISDFVFSPGKQNAKKYLDGQYAAIYNDFTSAITTNPDLSVIILQCIAKFEGTYSDYLDNPHLNIIAERPYYILFIGTTSQVKSIIDYKLFDLIKNGYQNKLVIQTIKNINHPDSRILSKKFLGSFERTEIANNIITGASVDEREQNKGLFGFYLAVDFSKSLQDENYFTDEGNYEFNNKSYSLQSEAIKDQSDPALIGYTHILKIQTNKLIDETLQIDVIGKTPAWVYSSTSTDDTKIDIDDSEKLKTFGFKYLIEGICDAFYPRSRPNSIHNFIVTIKK